MGDNRSSTPNPHYRTIVIEQADIAPILSPIDIERQFPVAALFFIFGWYVNPSTQYKHPLTYTHVGYAHHCGL